MDTQGDRLLVTGGSDKDPDWQILMEESWFLDEEKVDG